MISCAGTGGDDSSKGCASHSCQRRTHYRSNSRQTDGNSGWSLRGEGSNNSKINKKTKPHKTTATTFGTDLASRSVSISALPPGVLKGIINLPVRTSPFSLSKSPCGTNAGQHSPHHGGLTQGSSPCSHGAPRRSQAPRHGVCQPWAALRCRCPSASPLTGLLDGDY